MERLIIPTPICVPLCVKHDGNYHIYSRKIELYDETNIIDLSDYEYIIERKKVVTKTYTYYMYILYRNGSVIYDDISAYNSIDRLTFDRGYTGYIYDLDDGYLYEIRDGVKITNNDIL